MAAVIDSEATALTRARYDGSAPSSDLMQSDADRRLARHQRGRWRRVQRPRVLEVGVGTGRNMSLYPDQMAVTAVDISLQMLARAKIRAPRWRSSQRTLSLTSGQPQGRAVPSERQTNDPRSARLKEIRLRWHSRYLDPLHPPAPAIQYAA